MGLFGDFDVGEFLGDVIDIGSALVTSPLGNVIREEIFGPPEPIINIAGSPRPPFPQLGPTIGTAGDIRTAGVPQLPGTFEGGGGDFQGGGATGAFPGPPAPPLAGGGFMAGPPGVATQLTPITAMCPRNLSQVGGVFVDGGLFHTTPCGFRRPNTASLMVDPMTGQPAFFLHAGNPSGWSKWNKKGSRRKR